MIEKLKFGVLKSALELHKKELQEYINLSNKENRCSEEIKEEEKVKGISFEEHVSTTSNNNNPYVNNLILLKESYKCDSNVHRKKALDIRKLYNFDERFKKIDVEHQLLIYNIYFRCMSYDELAIEEGCTKKNIESKLHKAIKEMAGVNYDTCNG